MGQATPCLQGKFRTADCDFFQTNVKADGQTCTALFQRVRSRLSKEGTGSKCLDEDSRGKLERMEETESLRLRLGAKLQLGGGAVGAYGTLGPVLAQVRTRRLRAFAFGEAVVSRIINSGGTANFTGYSLNPWIRCSRMRAALSPISRSGCRMVVRRGLWYAAAWISSNPITEISSGTRRFASRSARITPIAAMSLKETIAVKARPCCNNSWTTG